MGRPCFFKVMFHNFSNKLRIPPAFRKEIDAMLLEKIALETNYHANKVWLVSVEKENNKDLFFGDGWSRFVIDHCLETGDFLVFFLIGPCTFEVLVFGKNGCQKKLNSTESKEACLSGKKPGDLVKVESDSEEIVEIAPSANAEHPQFATTLRKYRTSAVAVPRGFAAKIGLARKKKMVLKDPVGRSWKVDVHEKNRRFVLRNGWNGFVKGNNVAEGDTCVFQYLHRNVINVLVFRK